MKTLIPTLAAVSLALAATFAQAQMTPGGPGMGPVHEGIRAAYEACKDKPERRACMTEHYCAKSPDPTKCQAQAKERQARMAQRVEQRQKMHEACNGKRGEELTTCLRGQHQALRNQHLDERQKAHEACSGKRGEELGKCLGEQRQKFGPRGPQMRG
jgi:hypothetical protein